jgi:type IV pilus assembly protein PilW
MRRQRGFTLIELLISMALGLSLMGTVLGVLLAGRQNFILAREVALLQESARFALDFLSDEIRRAAYTGCAAATPLIHEGDSTWFFARPGVGGYDYDAGRASFPAEFRAAVRAGSDALVLRYGTVAESSPLQPGQAVLMAASNCLWLALGHWQASGGVESMAGVADAASVTPLELVSAAYYVGSSNSAPGVPALFRERLALNGTTHALYTVAEELVPGVEYLELLYGVDSSGDDGHADRYLQAQDVAPNWRQVVSVQIDLRLRTITPVYPKARPYPAFARQSAGSDRYLHQVFTTAVALRNPG